MSHLGTTRNPQSEARRQHIHGALEPADEPAFNWWPLIIFAVLVTAISCSANWWMPPLIEALS